MPKRTEFIACGFETCDRSAMKSTGLCTPHWNQRQKGQELQPLRVRNVGLCRFPDCDRTAAARGLCIAHHRQYKKGQELRPLRSRNLRHRNHEPCGFPACDRPKNVRGYCNAHYAQLRQGKPLAPLVLPTGKSRRTALGYALVPGHGHPNSRADDLILEHVLVVSNALGRPLTADENVHHLNGQRDDNRLCNLELWNTSQPPGQRIEDKLAWARDFVVRYGDEFVQPRFLST